MTYTTTQCLNDTLAIMPYARATLDELGSLVKCAKCGDSRYSVVPGEINNSTTVMALCDTELEKSERLSLKDWTMGAGSYFIVPDTDDDRKRMVNLFRKAIILRIANDKGLPIVTRLLDADCTSPALFSARDRVAIVWTQVGKTFKAYRCPMPWFESDPFLLGGKTARDALALVKSMLAGKTKSVSFGKGPVLMTSDDEGLAKAWGAKR